MSHVDNTGRCSGLCTLAPEPVRLLAQRVEAWCISLHDGVELVCVLVLAVPVQDADHHGAIRFRQRVVRFQLKSTHVTADTTLAPASATSCVSFWARNVDRGGVSALHRRLFEDDASLNIRTTTSLLFIACW